MKNNRSLNLIGTLVLLVSFAHGAQAQTSQTITLRQGLDGYTGTNTTLIISGATNQGKNYGKANNLIGGAATSERRSLLRFDLSDYAGQTVIGNATLKLAQANSGGTGTVLFDVFQISAANADWVQGNGAAVGTAATTGESAWAFKHKGASGESDALWAGSAGLNTAGVDYVANAVGTITFDTSRANGSEILVTIPQELIQLWIDTPSANGGLLFARRDGEINTGILGGFYSALFATSGYRPELSFQVAVPEASTYAMLIGGVVLAFVVVRRRIRRG